MFIFMAKIVCFLVLILLSSGSAYGDTLAPPEIVGPITKSKISLGTNIVYKWKASENATHYVFRISDTWLKEYTHRVRVNAADVCIEEECSYQLPESEQLPAISRYRWVVRAMIPSISVSTVSSSILFISGEVPDVPVTVSPDDKSTHQLPASLTYQWQAVEGATRYQFVIRSRSPSSRVYVDLNVPTSVCDIESATCSYQLRADTQLGAGSYVWRVRASNRVDHSTFTKSIMTFEPTPGEIVAGYDWELPEQVSENTNGGLVRGTWKPTDKEYTNTAFYSLRWNDVPVDKEGNYDFAAFDWWLNNGDADGDKVLVRLEVNSVCDAPSAMRSAFNYYAGGSIAFWEYGYIDALTDFVTAFADKYADQSNIIGVHLGIADGEYSHIKEGGYTDVCLADLYANEDGWGEFWVNENELKHAMEQGLTAENFTISVKKIIDAYTSAFEGHTSKLAMTNIGTFVYNAPDSDLVADDVIEVFNEQKINVITPHALKAGVGNRDGLIEDWMSYNSPIYGMNFRPGPNNSCYMTMDEDFAENMGSRYSGTENEEYGTADWLVERYGAFEGQPYRFLMSSLRALQMRRNYMQLHTEGLDELPDTDYNTGDFLHYLASTIGRDKTNTPDAFAVLGERYIRSSYVTGFDNEQFASADFESCVISEKEGDAAYLQVREFGRWLTEVGGKGVKSKQVVLEAGKEPWSIPSYLPDVAGSKKYEYSARESHEFTFDINDEVVSHRCPTGTLCEIAVKVVFEDSVATTLSVQTEVGTMASINTIGDGDIKTATLTFKGHFQNGFNGADFGLATGSEAEALPVMITRVNFNSALDESAELLVD
ncbi:hypothetical protein [Leucothrix arctica]|uniref:Uncharacterized protein n=1 Tax=Leucothrix arctica TaxID=1481894 RepID=A0A317CMX2_9GAMM|nr:hypothetical protein [Leucothrix arctica]PWQ99561.1 hypothetical protein DKT75_00380 [Leucothrix arctica]